MRFSLFTFLNLISPLVDEPKVNFPVIYAKFLIFLSIGEIIASYVGLAHFLLRVVVPQLEFEQVMTPW